MALTGIRYADGTPYTSAHCTRELQRPAPCLEDEVPGDTALLRWLNIWPADWESLNSQCPLRGKTVATVRTLLQAEGVYAP